MIKKVEDIVTSVLKDEPRARDNGRKDNKNKR